MTINFYLEKRKLRKNPELHIILWIREKGKALKVGTGEHILPKYWDLKKQRPKPNAPDSEGLADMLDAWDSEIKSIRRIAKASGKVVTFEYLKKNLSFIRQHDGTFFGVWDEYIKAIGKEIKNRRKKVKQSTINAYATTKATLEVINGTHPGLHDESYQYYNSMDRQREFITNKEYGKYEIEFGSINNDFVSKLEDYTMFMGYENEFCHRHLGRVKTFMRWAVKNEYIKDTSFENLETELPVKDDDANIYFLMAEELAYLKQMKIDNDRLDRVRDIFCFQCYTGFRISEVLDFKKDNHDYVDYNIIEIKTGKRRNNPLSEPAIEILKKYQDLPGLYALPKISQQKYNEYLRELARLAGLDRKINKQNLTGSDKTGGSYPLHDVISSHVGRKTYVTYLINSGMDKNIVRTWTGQSEAVIERYYKILAEYKKEQMAKLNKQYKKDAANGRKLRIK